MSNSQTEDEQFLPLDSSIKTSQIPDYSTGLGYRSDSISRSESEVFILTSKISELETSYIEMEKKYLRKIKELKQQLGEKGHVQCSLNQQLSNLAKQYDEHKSQIQKISEQIKKPLEQTKQNQLKQQKVKSISPKNQTNHSPKRLIKKSLEMAKKDIIQPKKQIFPKQISVSQQIDSSRNTQKSDRLLVGSTQFKMNQKQIPINQDHKLNISHQNSLNSSNQLKNGRKPLYSPTNQNNGPSTKKKLLFNSTKQLDLFSKPLPQKKLHIVTNGSPIRRINISPTQKKKQITTHQNKLHLQKQLKTYLPVIEQKLIRVEVKQINTKKINNSGTQQPSSPAHRRKAPSPQVVGFMRKKISNNNINLKTENSESLKQRKSAEKQKIQDLRIKQKTEVKQDSNVEQINTRQENSKKQYRIQVEKNATKSPVQSTKNIKISPQSKFSPTRKLLRNSPTHKKTQSTFGTSQRPKNFTNMREKLDNNIFK